MSVSIKPTEVKVFIPQDHHLVTLAEGLEGPGVLLERVSGLWDTLCRCWKTPWSTPLVFYTPYKPLPLVAMLCPMHRIFYLLHEPKLVKERVDLRTYLSYEIWLVAVALFCRFLCASTTGASVARERRWIAKRLSGPPVPLVLPFPEPPRFEAPEGYDLGMWGSINREKGIDRVLELARQAPDLRVGILSSDTRRMRKLQTDCAISLPNVTFELHPGGFSDADL